MYTRDKEPVYYAVEKSEKEQESRDITEKEEKVVEKEEQVVEECLSPTKEIEEYSFMQERHEETRKDVETTSIRERSSTSAPAFEVCAYRPPLPADDVFTGEVMERVEEDRRREERRERPCEEDERREQLDTGTPLLDRTIYYEREIKQGERTPERDSRQPSPQTLHVDEEISRANRKVDSALQEHAVPAPRPSPQPSIQSSMQERRVEERRSHEEKMSSKREERFKKTERFLDAPKAHSEKRGSFASAGLGAEKSRDSSFVSDYKKYERTAYGPPSRPASAARSTRTASDRSAHSPCYRSRYLMCSCT
ncbi:hypothetical protein GCK32_017316 [Trichostrongylus colubriformis]|uniref:Uncharacterized protein n=1 Tax=Trichostrongylus colubriformis TaxID=6319 RepID=A0AAN8F5D0_TRICO